MFCTTKRAKITSDIDLLPYTVLRRGETGTLVNQDQYGVDILMDKRHDGLDWWDNVAHVADGAELEYVSFSHRRVLRRTSVSRLALCVLVGLALLGCFEAVEDALQIHTGLHRIFVPNHASADTANN